MCKPVSAIIKLFLIGKQRFLFRWGRTVVVTGEAANQNTGSSYTEAQAAPPVLPCFTSARCWRGFQPNGRDYCA